MDAKRWTGLAMGLLMVWAWTADAQVAKPRRGGAVALPGAWAKVGARERLKVRRVAELDAMRALAERVYGFRLEGGSMVYDYVLTSDRVRVRMQALLKGARETEKAEYLENGTVQIVYGVTLRKVLETIKTSLKDGTFTYDKSVTKKDTVIEALGIAGIPGSQAHKEVLARRAAEVDAYRKMAEKIQGIKLESGTTVREYCVQSDQLRATVAAYLRGLKPIDVNYPGDDTCEVTIQLKRRTFIETVETVVKRTKGVFRTKTKTTVKVTTNSKDEVITTTGRGTWKDEVEAVPASANAAVDVEKTTSEAKTVVQRVLRKEIVVE
jgi:hypothetical protein